MKTFKKRFCAALQKPKIRNGLLSILVLILLCGCGEKIANRDSLGATIVCFGDSLTAGFGIGPGEDYPARLQEKTVLPVINAGKDGDLTATALNRLEQDVLENDPRIVIITLGGNDFLRLVPKQETLQNIETIVDRIQAKGAMIVWTEVRTGLFGDTFREDLKKMAHKKRFILIPNILQGILINPQYKYDQIHPNAEGYKIIAERIWEEVGPLLEERPRRRFL